MQTEHGVVVITGASAGIGAAQSAEDVAQVIACVIDNPRADVYTRPEGRALVARYYGAEDMSEVEGQPPFMVPAPRSNG